MAASTTSPFRRRLLLLAAIGLLGGAAWFFFFRVPHLDMDAIAAANNRGLGLLEQFQYAESARAFEAVVAKAPRWLPGRINLGIALLNTNTPENLERAQKVFEGVLRERPDEPHARFCMGIILRHLGKLEEAREQFRAVTRFDPSDASAWFWLGTTEDPSAPEARDAYRAALEHDPYLAGAIYALALAMRQEDPEKTKELLERHKKLTDSGQESISKMAYGKMGKYAEAIGRSEDALRGSESPLPAFGPWSEFAAALAPGAAWAKDADFGAGVQADLARTVRKRFGTTIAVLDFDQDGQPDLFVAGGVVEEGKVRDVLLRNLGGGKFQDVGADAGFDRNRFSFGCSVGDFDNDGFPDLLLTSADGVRLLRNRGKEAKGPRFADVTAAAGLSDTKAVCFGAAWTDLDQDGDLDLVVAPYAPDAAAALAQLAGKAPENPVGLCVYANIGKSETGPVGSVQRLSAEFRRLSEPKELVGAAGAVVNIAASDVDLDRDLDLVTFADRSAASIIVNDRLLRFRRNTLPETVLPGGTWNGALVLDSGNRDRSDLFVVGPGQSPILLRSVAGEGKGNCFECGTTNGPPLLQAVVADLDLDGRTDVVGLAETGEPVLLHNKLGSLVLANLGLGAEASRWRDVGGIACLDVDGDYVPDVVVWKEGSGLACLRNAGNGNAGLKIQLSGRREQKEKLRCNADGFGARIALHAGSLTTGMERTTLSAGIGQSDQPMLLGIGKRELAEVVRVRWPDGTWQAELSLPARQVARISQVDRTPDSCPLLFAWNGERYEFVADFLGAGTVGEYQPDGTCRPARPEESLKIEAHQLRPANGQLLLKLTEPMDEVTYLDRLLLAVVDHPAEVQVYPDERFASVAPSQDLHAFREVWRPKRAIDERGVDVTDALLRHDRNFVDGFARRSWLGYAEDHWVELDFGDRLASAAGKRLFLCLFGWTDYPYPEAMWAATQAGVPLTAPTLEQFVDGRWKAIDLEVGFPAGRPRMMAVELTGKLHGAGKLRLRSNMQVFWDEIFLAPSAESIPEKETAKPGSTDAKEFRVTVLPVAQASLAVRGCALEYSPDGKQPTLFDYHQPVPTPVTRLRGKLTRLGDVTELLHARDDRFVLFGPGDEVSVRFDGTKLPPLPSGWSRSYVLRTWGYCKGVSPFTETGGQIEPLPFHAMSGFPYGKGESYPKTPEHAEYLRRYNTRSAGRD